MEIKVEEISRIIRKQIEDYDKHVEISETGTVLSAGDGIARVYGLEKAMAGELLEFPHGVMGMTLNLESDNVGVALLGDAALIREGDEVRRTGRIVEVPVTYLPRRFGTTHVGDLRSAAATLDEVVRYWWAARGPGTPRAV